VFVEDAGETKTEMNPEKYEAWFLTPFGRWADRAEKKLIARAIQIKPGDKFLDAGCGTAHFTAEFVKYGGVVYGLDSSREMLDYARTRHPGPIFIRGDAEAAPFGENRFDVAVMITVLEFMKEPRRALLEMKRILKPSGHLVLGFLNRRGPWGILRRIRAFLGNAFWKKAHLFGRRDISELLFQAGFGVIDTRSVLFRSFLLVKATPRPPA
jgi:SAM-dependent methyltransferase